MCFLSAFGNSFALSFGNSVLLSFPPSPMHEMERWLRAPQRSIARLSLLVTSDISAARDPRSTRSVRVTYSQPSNVASDCPGS